MGSAREVALIVSRLEVQEHQARIVTHVHLGEGFSVAGMRKNVTGWIDSPVVVFWGIERQ